MITFQTKLRPSLVTGHPGSIIFLVKSHRTVKQVTTSYRLFPYEWDCVCTAIIVSAGLSETRRSCLAGYDEALRSDIRRLKETCAFLDRSGGSYTASEVVDMFLTPDTTCSFFSFARDIISQLRQIGRDATADTYATAISSFTRFRRGCDVQLVDIDSVLMTTYEGYLKSCGICLNTISFYMRNLRAIYNRSVESELTVQRYPFRHVYTGIGKTVKRAVPLGVIRQIRDLDLTMQPNMSFARDLFMFSFYTRGMSFVDMAFLKKKDLQNGVLSYRRHKTNQQLFVKWEKPMQELIDKYDTTGSPYLLPIVKNNGKNERLQYKNQAHLTNRCLKKIGEQIGLNIPLTTYVARHGWASIAKSKNIPVATISEAMGHDSEATTRIYLATLDTSVVDKANSLILSSL